MEITHKKVAAPQKALLLTALLCAASIANASDGDPIAVSYAQMHGVSLVEAKRRLARVPYIGQLDKRLQRELPDTFAGLYIEHEPSYRVVVRFTKDAQAQLARYTSDSIFVAETAPYSLEFLLSAQDELGEQLASSKTEFQSGLDLSASAIDMFVRDPTAISAQLAGFKSTKDFLRLHRAEGFIEPTADIVGGGQLDGANLRCTAGFNVVNSVKILGLVTAGHCDNAATYMTGLSVPLIHVTEMDKGSYDLQWHTQSSSGVRRTQPNQIRIPGGPVVTMSITSAPDSTTLPVGTTVCKSGITTRYTCGEIADKNAQAMYNGEIGSYIRVHNAQNKVMNEVGDSGGPVFGTNAAYGIVHGRGGSGTPTRNDLYYMPIERLSILGLSVVTAPFAISSIPNVAGPQNVNIPAKVFFTGYTHFPVLRHTAIVSCPSGWSCSDYDATYQSATASPLTFNFLCSASSPTATFRWKTTLKGADGVESNAVEHTSTCTANPGVVAKSRRATGRPKIEIVP
ncbi:MULTISPECIES: S1 family peptidase [unclassified Lysobacter]|uniref:S1 family peptidase n=1 Tax=unclassified Lysobacter TaxID=2635362 RepID=UPI001BE4EDFC|nr:MULTISPECIES: S1 family peptidase [unclassified Lysobacter]MBT2745547.1 trypsin-like serine protease [Lysobacter sp. ISL-42]MBT2753486.1 trypsin-like serine protease [Lysobacter sp. ISL-50]MBT2777130.1 trypsin-like serine protease [Lysobacter sp. ISL-54]MBT2780244.1 trypsin-like serine protease [Lysobacter sp. ISL-52]